VEPRVDPKPILRFGLYEADLPNAALTRQGVRIKIQEQPFRILAMLLQRPGEIVTREDLRQALWPEGTHVNFDGSLNAALKKLRAAIQDDAENPRFIETVPRQGYRFLAPVQTVVPAPPVVITQVPAEESAEEPFEVHLRMEPEFSPERAAELEKGRRKVERAARWFDDALLFFAILFGSWLLFFIVYPVPRPSVQRMTRITNARGIDEWGGIVSDGTRIFFLERDGGHWNLMQTSVEGGNAEKVAAPFENTRVFGISPDHSQFLIGQFTRRDDEMPLWLWPVQGGAPRRMGEAVGHDPAWSPDGSQVIYVRGRSLLTVHADGTQQKEIAHGPGLPHSPTWSPDGDKIRFSMDQRSDGAPAVWEMDADGSGLHPILASGREPAHQSGGRWTADGKYFLFSGCQNSDCNLWSIREGWNWLRRSHHDPFQLTRGPDSLHVSIPTQMGSRVFAFSFRSQRELQRIAADGSYAEKPMLSANAEEAVVSPDGKFLLYTDRPDGALWRSRIDGTQQLQLTKPPLVASSARWSRDGKMILFTGVRPGALRQIYLISADGGALRAVLPEGREAADADWSPDGTQIVVSMREQKTQAKFGIYLFKPSTGEGTLLPESRGLTAPRWSPDGRYIAALDGTNHGLLLYDFQTEKWDSLAQGGLLGAPYWLQDSSRVYFQDQLNEEQEVFRMSVATHQVERVFGCGEILKTGPTHCLFNGLNADGSFYLMIERGLTDIYALDLELP
jgi:Tol biopolymer transport system component/DNA-binding winged helix-turn-helix (wHTH) protein